HANQFCPKRSGIRPREVGDPPQVPLHDSLLIGSPCSPPFLKAKHAGYSSTCFGQAKQTRGARLFYIAFRPPAGCAKTQFTESASPMPRQNASGTNKPGRSRFA